MLNFAVKQHEPGPSQGDFQVSVETAIDRNTSTIAIGHIPTRADTEYYPTKEKNIIVELRVLEWTS